MKLAPALIILVACGGGTDTTEPDAGPDAYVGPPRAPELGTGDHTPASVGFTTIAIFDDGLREPRDLGFNPLRPDELWVVNFLDDSVVIVHDASTPARTSERRIDDLALHFMDAPTAIAFGGNETTIGVPGTFATCGESRNTYNGMADANDFMGPTLWSSDLGVFALQTQGGDGSHMDMLHCSPLCMGLAHETANEYWAFAGLYNSIVHYDFNVDDGLGNDNHRDGEAYQYVTGQMGYVEGVPSHLIFDGATQMLYIADTGHSRVARLDTTTGVVGDSLIPMEFMEAYDQIDGAELVDLVAAETGLLTQPAGIEQRGEWLYVSDHATGIISAFTLVGEQVNWLDTGLGAGALGGMAFGPDGKLYFVDMAGDRVLRIDP